MNGMETVDPNIVRQCCRPRMQQAYLEIILYHCNMKYFPTHQGGTSSILYMRSLCLDPVSLPASFTVSSRDASMSSVLFEVFLLEPPESFQKQNSSLLHVILSQKIELLKINHKLILYKKIFSDHFPSSETNKTHSPLAGIPCYQPFSNYD